MIETLISALAEVLDIDMNGYDHLSQTEQLAMLEDIQAKEVLSV